MNSVGVLLRVAAEPEDFFTNLTFSTLLGELTPKGKSYCYESFDTEIPTYDQKVKIKADFDRVWNAKEDENFLNKIFS